MIRLSFDRLIVLCGIFFNRKRVIDARHCLLDQLFDGIKVLFIARHANHHRFAIAACTTCAADPVHVVFGVARHIIVEHMAHGRDVKSTRGDVRGNQESQRSVAESIQSFGALALIQITVNRRSIITVFFQRLSDRIHIHLTIAEDDRVRAFLTFVVDQHTQCFTLFRAFAILARGFEHHHNLFDILGRGRLTRNFDAGRIGQERVGDPLDLRGHRGREEQRLTRKRREAENAFNVGDETHVEHAVRFVDDHNLHASQEQFASLNVIEQTTRRCDQNVDAFIDQAVLLFEGHAAD